MKSKMMTPHILNMQDLQEAVDQWGIPLGGRAIFQGPIGFLTFARGKTADDIAILFARYGDTEPTFVFVPPEMEKFVFALDHVPTKFLMN